MAFDARHARLANRLDRREPPGNRQGDRFVKQLVVFESVVADDRLVRIALQRAQLIKPGHEEGKLRLKCSAGLTIVKSRKERIVFGLSDALRVQPVRNNARERALAYANRTVQGDVPGGIEELGHKPGLLGA